jgi:hypothetical protein
MRWFFMLWKKVTPFVMQHLEKATISIYLRNYIKIPSAYKLMAVLSGNWDSHSGFPVFRDYFGVSHLWSKGK